MDILNFISWIKGGRIVKTVDPKQSLLPIAVRDPKRDDGWLTNAMTVEDFTAQIKPYKVYTALLSQSGTDAPIATVLENTLGGEIVWIRDYIGQYTGTLTGAFPLDKSFIIMQHLDMNGAGGSVDAQIGGPGGSPDIVVIYTNDIDFNSIDGSLYYSSIEIRVY